VLENHDMDVLSPTTGGTAIEVIASTPDSASCCMDIMMPEMDGYATMREIRTDPRFKSCDPGADRESHEGRPREVPRGGRLGLHRQAVDTDQLLSLAPGLAVPVMAGTTSTRTAEVPVQRPAAPGAAPLDEEVVQILLVDDQPANLEALQASLGGTGCQFVSARSADEALLALLDQDFAAIVLDVRMPA